MTIKDNEKMTSKERVQLTLANQIPDRVPIDYDANPGIDSRLKKHFRLKQDDNDELLKMLGVDFRRIDPPYAGPRLHAQIPGRTVLPEWGIHTRWIEHESGGYWDYCDFPLQEADEEQVAAWPMPSPDDFDYSFLADTLKKYEKLAISVGGAGIADCINSNGMLRGMEQTLVDLITDDPAGLLLMDRRHSVQIGVLQRILDIAKDKICFLMMGEDLGTQYTPMISLELYRKHIRPRHQRFVDLAKAYNLPVMIHTCGSSSWAYEDFIDMGINAVDTLQPEAKNMSPAYLKEHFGGRLAFHGCISTAGPVAFGSVEDVAASVKETLDIMMPGGGYCMSPTHQLQDNSPTENVLAMYEAAHIYGRY